MTDYSIDATDITLQGISPAQGYAPTTAPDANFNLGAFNPPAMSSVGANNANVLQPQAVSYSTPDISTTGGSLFSTDFLGNTQASDFTGVSGSPNTTLMGGSGVPYTDSQGNVIGSPGAATGGGIGTIASGILGGNAGASTAGGWLNQYFTRFILGILGLVMIAIGLSMFHEQGAGPAVRPAKLGKAIGLAL
jgi:hypothetical protein